MKKAALFITIFFVSASFASENSEAYPDGATLMHRLHEGEFDGVALCENLALCLAYKPYNSHEAEFIIEDMFKKHNGTMASFNENKKCYYNEPWNTQSKQRLIQCLRGQLR
jgi:hypothetical protein